MEIKRNENTFDRFVKTLIGLIMIYLTFLFIGQLNMMITAVLLFASLWLIITGVIGYCPLYHLLGINTEKRC
jgi:hypothetical protein